MRNWPRGMRTPVERRPAQGQPLRRWRAVSRELDVGAGRVGGDVDGIDASSHSWCSADRRAQPPAPRARAGTPRYSRRGSRAAETSGAAIVVPSARAFATATTASPRRSGEQNASKRRRDAIGRRSCARNATAVATRRARDDRLEGGGDIVDRREPIVGCLARQRRTTPDSARAPRRWPREIGGSRVSTASSVAERASRPDSPAGEHFREHRAEREDVGAVIHGPPRTCSGAM